ncbi:LOW QUALITY PROTEIN: melanoma antigen preferentially expressed in tumors-like [Dugong dugon]
MNSTGPRGLLDLATQSLLRAEAWAIAALESLAMELFPPLFMEAVAGRHSETLKDRSSVCSFWDPEVIQPRIKRRKVDDSRTGEKQTLFPLEVLIDLCLEEATQVEFLTFLIKRFKQSKGQLQLCCRKLKIVAMPLQNIEKILNVQEVEVNYTWELSTLARFAPHLGQMFKLDDGGVVEKLVTQFSSQLLCLHQLQKLYLGSVLFLKVHLDQVLRCLKNPLETLTITNCLLLESDLIYLSLCPNTSHLRYLNLRDVNLTGLSPEFLQVLLEENSATLHHLNFDGCGITDSQLTTILPALGRCSQLTSFSFCGNSVSMAVLEGLLQHTLPLSKFRLGVLPIPLECYLGIQASEALKFRARLSPSPSAPRPLLEELQVLELLLDPADSGGDAPAVAIATAAAEQKEAVTSLRSKSNDRILLLAPPLGTEGSL